MLVLVVESLLEVEETGHNVSSGLALHKVVKNCTAEYFHRFVGPVIIQLPGVLELRDGGTTNCHQVNVDGVRGRLTEGSQGMWMLCRLLE